MISVAMKRAQCNTSRASESFSPPGDRAVEHVMTAEFEASGSQLVVECIVRPAKRGEAKNPEFVVFFMDDVISIQ